MSIEVTNLVKLYGEQRAVNDITFTAKKGEIVGFLGPNGAGKSTTMKIATCFIPPTSGTVAVCGFDVEQNPIEVRQKIGYLPENNPLYTEMYVQEYLAFMGQLYGLKGAQLQERVKLMLEITGLIPEKNKKTGQLSKGYRQRVGLAAALIHDPEVLILDEPTTGLDPNQIVDIRKLIKQVGKEKTVLFSTHIMQEVEELCDRVIIINSGKIVADNKVDSLSASLAAKMGYKVIVQFSEQIDSAMLTSIDGVTSIESLEANKYVLYSSEKDIRPAIFKLSGEKNWSLIELKMEEISVEQIFQSLTKK